MNKFLVLLLWFSLSVVYGQQRTPIIDDEELLREFLEDFIENLDTEEEFDFNAFFERLQDRIFHPINLNETSYEDLKSLLFLNDIQINGILEHRESVGDFMSLLELQSIPSLDLNTIRRMLPFTTVNESGRDYYYSISDMLKNGRGELYIKGRRIIEQQNGYIKDENGESNFLGDPNRIFTRLKYAYRNKLKIGITAEKDAGETFGGEYNKAGFDFYSAHIHLRDYNRYIKDLVIGDYNLQFGQGLILHNQFGGTKTANVTNIKRGGRTLRSYSSVNEYNYYRGVGLTLSLGDHLNFTPFVSYKNVGANVIEKDTLDIESEFTIFSSIKNDGLHRTVLEIEKENAIQQFSTGGVLRYANRRGSIGLNVLYDSFNSTFERRSQLYNQFQFRGKSLLNGSIDYSYRYKNINAFGEIAMSDNGGMAMLTGFLVGLDKTVDLAVMYRNYGVDYQSLNSNSFGETQGTTNENGIYMGLTLRPNRNWTINAYADLWKHEWLRFRRDAPSRGNEFLIKINYYEKRKRTFYVQYRREEKQINSSNPEYVIDKLTKTTLHRFRVHYAHNLNGGFESRSRLEYSIFEDDNPATRGYLIYQDLLYKPRASKLSFAARLAYFNIEDFDNRIYTFENDLIYEFYIPFFQNIGMRYYLKARYDWNRNLTTEMRVARTQYSNIDEISSGNTGIIGNKQTEIKAQIRYRF